jgi:hypothetical protein
VLSVLQRSLKIARRTISTPKLWRWKLLPASQVRAHWNG